MIITRIKKNKKAADLCECTFNYLYEKQYKLLKQAIGEEQKQYFKEFLRFWTTIGDGDNEGKLERILGKIYCMEKQGYQGWKRRDRVRASGHALLESLNLDSTVKNIRHYFKK